MAKRYVGLVNLPQTELLEPLSYLPLGLLYLGAVLKREGHDVEFLDYSTCKNLEMIGTTKEYPLPEKDIYLISATTPLMSKAKSLIEIIKSFYPESKVAIGGPHITAAPYDGYIAGADIIVTGEGELIIPMIVNHLINGVFSGGLVKNLDKIPFPARDLLPKEKVQYKGSVHGEIVKGSGATTIITSRGCPYNCYFCCKTTMHSRVRYRSPENVIAEIRELKEKYDIWQYRFVDDCFTVNRKRVETLCDLLKQEEVYWLAITRADRVDKPLLEKMYEAGCREIQIGVETASPRLLKIINKKETVEDYKRAIKHAKEVGLKVKVYLMYGLPGETEEDIELTKRFMLETQPDKWTLAKFVPLPGSKFYKEFWKYMIEIPKSFDDYWFYSEEDHPFRQWLKEHFPWRQDHYKSCKKGEK